MNDHRPTVLCVEDKTSIQDSIRRFLEQPSDMLRDAHGGPVFRVTKALTGETAEKLLRQAKDSFTPFDVLLLDLGLPWDSSSKESISVGKRLLEQVGGELAGTCNAVVVQSAFTEFDHVRDAIRSGAADFVAKPFLEADIYAAVVSAYKRSRDRLALRWHELKSRQRQQWIVAQACVQVADRILTTVSDNLGAVLGHSDEIAREITDRFKFDFVRDRDELICREVTELNSATRRVAEACSAMRPEVHSCQNGIERICLEDVVKQVVGELLPGITYKRLRMDVAVDESHNVWSLREEIESTVRELVFGAIEACPDGAKLCITVAENREKECVEVKVIDEAEPLRAWTPDDIDFRFAKNAGDQRIWILSLVARLAKSIGGTLLISSGLAGNTVVLQISGGGHD